MSCYKSRSFSNGKKEKFIAYNGNGSGSMVKWLTKTRARGSPRQCNSKLTNFCFFRRRRPSASLRTSGSTKVKGLRTRAGRGQGGKRGHSERCLLTAITLTRTVCLFWLFACAEAVTSHSTVFNKRSTLPWEPLSLSSIQPLELLPTNTRAPFKSVTMSTHAFKFVLFKKNKKKGGK